MMRKKHLCVLAIGLIALSALAQNKKINLPIVEVQGKQYYIYEAKKNQTFFNIANDFNWDLDELMRINSKVMSPLTKGTKIYYPADGRSLDSDSSFPGGINAVEGEQIVHLIKKGETVYSISRLYSVPVEKIYALNPESRAGIKAGETLKIREATTISTPESNPEFYVVKKGDTLYQLARTFNTTVAAILTNNPGISESSFRAGSTIKLPGYGEGLKIEEKTVEETNVIGFSPYKVEKNDTWGTVAEKTGVSVEDLKSANKETSKLKNNQIIGVPELVTDTVTRIEVAEDPRELTINGVEEIYSDVHGLIEKTNGLIPVRIGIVMADPTSRKDLDFTRGFLTGIDRLKKADYKITLKVFDGRGSHDALIDSLGNFDAKILFTTYEKNTPAFFADYALVSQTPVVNTFDLKDEQFLENPYFINILTPSNYFNEEVANNLFSRVPDSKLIIVGSESDGNDLLDALTSKWEGRIAARLSSPESLLDYTFKPGQSYLIFGNLSKKEAIETLSETIGKIRDDEKARELYFLGRPSWIVYDESLGEQFKKADVMIPSRFYYDKDSWESQSFIKEYRNLFKMIPAKSFPMYSVMGYDEAVYFIPSIASTGGDLNSFRPSTVSVQSDFELYRPTNWSGMINPVVYLVRFTPFGNIEKIKIK